MPYPTPSGYGERLRMACELIESKGITLTEAAQTVGVSAGRLSEYRRGLYTPPDELEKDFVSLRKRCDAILARAYRHHSPDGRFKPKFPCRVVFFDDLHAPFTDLDALRQVIERERGADVLVTFELLNFDAFARFEQTYLSNPEVDEEVGLTVVRLLNGAFGCVVAGNSNHVARPARSLARLLRPEQQEYILNRLRSFADAASELGIVSVNGSFVQIGDAAFCHYDRAMLTPGKTPERALNRVRAYGDLFGLDTDVRAVFTGHTHRVSQTPMMGGKGYLYEVGCGTYVPPYALDHARAGGWSGYRMATGYGIAVFDHKGRIDLTESRAVHLGWARLPDLRR